MKRLAEIVELVRAPRLQLWATRGKHRLDMTLSILLAVHLAYGALLAFTTFPRMRSEGEVLGWPLVFTLLPVGLASFPLSAVLLRYAGGWFLHGALIGEHRISFERFHLGFMFGVGALLVLATLAGNFLVVVFLSREKSKAARLPYALAFLVVFGTLIWQGAAAWTIHGTQGVRIWEHPAGLVSVANLLFLVAGWWWGKQKLSRPIDPGPSLAR
ncbi:MAG: hypothetical protein GY822_26625 [Deltaproteobacteria bacterium]|nr:hypothetical protein [Deltaproteobacteria bacterium]